MTSYENGTMMEGIVSERVRSDLNMSRHPTSKWYSDSTYHITMGQIRFDHVRLPNMKTVQIVKAPIISENVGSDHYVSDPIISIYVRSYLNVSGHLISEHFR